MTDPTNSNAQIAAHTLANLGFYRAIDWQQTIDGHWLARFRRRDLLVTLLLEGKRLTIAMTDRTDLTIPARFPKGATEVAQVVVDAGVSCQFRPEGIL